MPIYPRYYPVANQGYFDENDYNAVVAHTLGSTLSGTLHYPVSFQLRTSGGHYEILNRLGTLVYGGVADTGGVSGDDGGALLNAARADIVTAAVGGAIGISNGHYHCPTRFTGGNAVELIGESMGPFDDFTKGAVLEYTGASADPFIDYRDCRYMGIQNLKLHNAGASTIGLRVGGVHNDTERTKAIFPRNVVIDGFDTGILGDTFGPDDSSLYDVYIGNATTCGIDHLSSQFKIYGGSIYGTTGIGLRVSRTVAAQPDSAMECYGTVWSGPSVCVDVAGNQTIRGLSFFGCWFEDIDTKLLDITNADAALNVGSILFENCFGYTNAGADSIFDLRGRSVSVEWKGGELYPADNPTTIRTDGVGATYQYVRITHPIAGQERISFTDANSGLRGFERYWVPFIDTITGYECLATGVNYVAVLNDHKCPWYQYQIIKATAYYKWDPNSNVAGLRLCYPAGVAITGSVSEPGADGLRSDTLDISAFARATMDRDGAIVTEAKGDGANDAALYLVGIIYEY